MKREFLVAVLALAAGFMVRADAQAAAATQNPNLVTLDTTDLDLVERSAGKKVIEFDIPVRLSDQQTRVLRWNISLDGRLIAREGSSIVIPTDNGEPRLAASFDLSKLNAAGHYVATIEFTNKPVDPGNAKGTWQAQTVQLKLNRPAAELHVSTPLSFKRTVFIPYFWADVSPDTITLSETAGKSWVTIDPASWDVVLRHGDDPTEQHVLKVTLPNEIDGWGQAGAAVNLDGPISLGTTAGTLTIRAPQLAAQSVDFPLTVVSRLSGIWLLVIIVAGIAIGWYYRDDLDTRRARLLAVLPAEQELATLDDCIKTTADDEFRKNLEATRGKLAKTIDDPASTAENITTATSEAANARQAVQKAINDLRGALQTSLNVWNEIGSMQERLPDDVGSPLRDLRNQVAELQESLASGELTKAKATVTSALPATARMVRTAVCEWQRQFQDLVPAKWPDVHIDLLTNVAQEAGQLGKSLDACEGLEGPSATAETGNLAESAAATKLPATLWRVLVEATTLLDHVRQDVFGTVAKLAHAAADIVIDELRKWPVPAKVEAISAASQEFPGDADAGKKSGVRDFADRLNALRKSIVDGLNAAWADPAKPLTGLDQGDFLAAISALVTKRQMGERDLGGETPPATTAPSPADVAGLLAMGPKPVAAPKWTISLEAVDDATVSEAVRVRARLVVASGNQPKNVTLQWSKAGIPDDQNVANQFERSYVFSEPGPVAIRVTATDGDGVAKSATLVLQVLAVHGARAIASVRATLTRIETMQNSIAAVIITAAGWIIFSPSFTGTIPDLFAAFLWGFSADIGAAKVRELAESVKGMKLPITSVR